MILNDEFYEKKAIELKWNMAIVNLILYHNNYSTFKILFGEICKYYRHHLIRHGYLCISQANLKEYLDLFCDKGILKRMQRGYSVIDPEEWYFLFSKQYIEQKKIDERCILESISSIKRENGRIDDKTTMRNETITHIDPYLKKIIIDMIRDRDKNLRSLNIKKEWKK